ncbi:MAG: hypothetical protein QM765_42155 [Myxococcales bacterium]
MGRWDYLYELKPVPASEAFVEEAAKIIAKDLGVWPLQVTEWATPQDAARFGPLLAPDSLPPDASTFTEAFKLARLELMREFEQIDDYMRNERWRAFVPPGRGVELLLFLTRYLTEQMLSINEATEGRIKRPMLVDLLTRTERHLKSRALILPS